MKTRKLVCIVEGKGELAAVPCLCVRIRDELQAWRWHIDSAPVRWDRARMVDQRVASPLRGVHAEFERAVQLAFKRADAVLALCDQDDDCPVHWSDQARDTITQFGDGGALMAVREFETWLISGCYTDAELRVVKLLEPELKRDGKSALRRLFPLYKPTLHQRELVSKLDLARARNRSRSFRKLCTELQRIFMK